MRSHPETSFPYKGTRIYFDTKVLTLQGYGTASSQSLRLACLGHSTGRLSIVLRSRYKKALLWIGSYRSQAVCHITLLPFSYCCTSPGPGEKQG